MESREQALVFTCQGEKLIGVLHPGAADVHYGVLIVVGGPQYRIGSHRQFVLMARALASAGIPVLRFDCRGMGDADGERVSFESLDADIAAAVATLRSRLPQIERVVLLGLCDGASAALIHGSRQKDVSAMILVNPWVRDEADGPRAPLRQYYLARLRKGGLWRKVSARRLGLIRSVGVFLRELVNSGRRRGSSLGPRTEPAFRSRMRAGLVGFEHPVLVLVSGDDLTGNQFLELCRSNASWRAAAEASRMRTHVVEHADHTMSSRAHLDEAVTECISWLQEACGASSAGP